MDNPHAENAQVVLVFGETINYPRLTRLNETKNRISLALTHQGYLRKKNPKLGSQDFIFPGASSQYFLGKCQNLDLFALRHPYFHISMIRACKPH